MSTANDDLVAAFNQVLDVLNLSCYDQVEKVKTANRLADMFQELFSGLEMDPAMPLDSLIPIESPEGTSLIHLGKIRFYSMCMHHWLPFFGQVDVVFQPASHTVGIGKIARVVYTLAHRPQIQESFTADIADVLNRHLKPVGLAVVVQARQFCIEMRGTRAEDSVMRTAEIRGDLKDWQRYIELMS